MDEHREVPGPAAANNERITARPHGGFASLPEDEVDRIPAHGAGPSGLVDDGPRLPLVVVGVGILVIFLTFLVNNPWPLAFGLVLVLGGAIWAGLVESSPGSMQGTGTSRRSTGSRGS